ncbi:MAG: sigma-70 family RNA polymerase sigma factor [Planctomycetota bacterium]
MSDDLTRSLDLMRQAQAGDGEALNRLMARYYERVRPIVRARLGNRLRRRVDSGDIVQQTFVAAFKSLDRFDVQNEASLIGWLAKIAERQIHDEHDRQSAGKRSPELEIELDASSGSFTGLAIPDTPANSPEGPVIRAEEARALEDCLAELPELYRELLLLRDYAGHSWEEVAELTGRPTAAAARMMHAQARIELGRLVQSRLEE